MAQNLNQAGLKFVLTGRRADRLKELKNELDYAEIIAGDITDPDLAGNLIKTALENFGRCDIVFNNAGVINMATIEEINVEDICHMVRVTGGAYAGTKHAIEALTEGLRMELAKTNIAAACIEPGLVQTEIFRQWDEFPAEQFDIPNPLQPEDIARVVRFVLEQPGHIRIPRILAISADQEL